MIGYFNSLYRVETLNELLEDHRKIDKMMLRLVLLHWLFVSMFSAYFYGMHLFGFVSGMLLSAVSYVAYRTIGGTPMFRILMGVVLMTFTIISIQQNLGRIEMHFHIFVVLSFLTAYKDSRPVSVAAIYSIIHHLSFNYFQEHNVSVFDVPIMVFSYGCGLDIVLLHTFFVMFEWVVLVGVIGQATRRFLNVVRARRKLENQAMSLKQSAAVFENADEGILVTDRNGNITSVNRAFEDVTGYAESDAVARTPSILKSGRHDREFFRQMWLSLERSGTWKGEIWNKTKEGIVIPMWLSISAITNSRNEVTNYIGLLTDMTRIVKANEEINYMAYHDTLTGLSNRDYFYQQLQHAIYLAKRSQTKMAILFIDLDRFKIINDTLGHQIGDEMLKVVAHRIENMIRESDTLARIGGDEFMVLIENISSENHAAVVAEKIINVVRLPIQVSEHTLHTTASVGISIFPNDGEECMLLVKSADSAMYHAKDEGKNTYRFYTAELSASIRRHMELENALHHAIEREELYTVYQPQYDLQTRRIIGVEALLRWESAEYGMVSPVEFIPIAEENRMIVEIGMWVFETACAHFKAWHHDFPELRYVSVNMSSIQFDDPLIVDKMISAVNRIGIDPSNIELEITERIIVEQSRNSTLLKELHGYGFRIAVDDFGTGYSSMNYLKILPLDTIKIDKAFIDELPESQSDIAIVKAILALASSLGYRVIAEGIETLQQEDIMRELGCSSGQGYYFSKPLEDAMLTDLFETWVE